MNAAATTARTHRTRLCLAFAAVYVIWGSTYLAIRYGVATLPPFLMAGCRFVLAGSLLLGWLQFRGYPLPTRRQWQNAAVVGSLLLAGGNGVVCWAELTVNSSFAALVIASAPIWFAWFDFLRPGGARPRGATVLGLVVGFGGVVLLVTEAPARHDGQTANSLLGVLAIIFACASWAGGSIYGKYYTKPGSPWVATAAQMLCGGAANLVVALVRGEFFTFQPTRVSTASLIAFFYLIIFGSMLGFSAYVWLLEHCAPAKVATYAYVNPVIATLLGWMVLREPLTPVIGLAALIILAGVFIVQWPGFHPRAVVAAKDRPGITPPVTAPSE